MLIETQTTISEDIGSEVMEVTIRHDMDYVSPFIVKIGCLEMAYTEEELRLIQKVIAKSLITFGKMLK